jgi:glucose/arabinose dehydrogenase
VAHAFRLAVLLLFVLTATATTPGAASDQFATLDVRPWSQPLPFLAGLALLPNGRALVTEKDTGRIRVIERDGRVRRKPFARLRVFSGAEYGLLGIAVDPRFGRHPYVYVYYVEPTPDGQAPRRARLVRFRVRDGLGTARRVLVDDLRTNAETIHVGGAIAFQGDQLLLAVGDGSPSRADPRAEQAQEPASQQGKILRLTRDGRPAPGNPFPKGILTVGHRNSYGVAVDPKSRAIFETENGPDQSDEVNRIVPGRNYGWPHCEGFDAGCRGDERYTDPLWETGPSSTLALTGIVSYRGKRVPALRDTVCFCGFKDGALYALRLSAGQDAVLSTTRYSDPGWSCGAALAVAADGAVLFTDQLSGRVMRIIGSG